MCIFNLIDKASKNLCGILIYDLHGSGQNYSLLCSTILVRDTDPGLLSAN